MNSLKSGLTLMEKNEGRLVKMGSLININFEEMTPYIFIFKRNRMK